MDEASWVDATLAWIGAHPVAAGALIFLVAFCDALIILGAIVPALPLLFAVGVLIGLDEISGVYAVVCASLGAFAGDAVSYWVGHRWGGRLRGVWPFHRYPQLLDRAETLFRRNEFKSILVARYVGPIRPFVPAIAGMSGMPLRRYLPVGALASASWAVLFLLPGWVLGSAYDAVAAVAGRLALVLFLLLCVIAAVWAAVLYTYRWFAAHADALLARALAWSHRHPVLGRYSMALFDPQRRESTSLALLGALLLAIGWAWFALLAMVIAADGPLRVDLAVHEAMLALRNPLADYPMAALASLGGWAVLGPASALVMLYLLWRRRWIAAAHWMAALAFGLALTSLLGASVEIARPATASSGFGFPSIAVTMTTICFGFFAVLIARELPGRSRVWPYLVSGSVVAVIGFARIYLGAHWLSDVIGGMLFGITWLLVLGIAYRRRVGRSFWVKPVAWLFYGAFAAAALWYAPRNIEAKLERFEPPVAMLPSTHEAEWWRQGWQALPARRNEFDDEQRWPLDVQVAGPLAPLQARLEAAGWRVQPQAGWEQALNLLDTDLPVERMPILPATLDTRVEALLMVRAGARPEERYVLRLWPAPLRLQPGDAPLWIGSAQILHFWRGFDLVGLWRPAPDARPALEAVVAAIPQFEQVLAPHPDSGLQVLRIRVAGNPDEAETGATGEHGRPQAPRLGALRNGAVPAAGETFGRP